MNIVYFGSLYNNLQRFCYQYLESRCKPNVYNTVEDFNDQKNCEHDNIVKSIN